MPDHLHLTPVEHELMQILWKLKSGTVRDVLACLPENRNLAYTSVSTILRILQQKKIVSAEKNGKQHIYHPLLSKEKFASYSINSVVNNMFAGSSANLVAYLVDQNNLQQDEITALQQLLASKQRNDENA